MSQAGGEAAIARRGVDADPFEYRLCVDGKQKKGGHGEANWGSDQDVSPDQPRRCFSAAMSGLTPREIIFPVDAGNPRR